METKLTYPCDKSLVQASLADLPLSKAEKKIEVERDSELSHPRVSASLPRLDLSKARSINSKQIEIGASMTKEIKKPINNGSTDNWETSDLKKYRSISSKQLLVQGSLKTSPEAVPFENDDSKKTDVPSNIKKSRLMKSISKYNIQKSANLFPAKIKDAVKSDSDKLSDSESESSEECSRQSIELSEEKIDTSDNKSMHHKLHNLFRVGKKDNNNKFHEIVASSSLENYRTSASRRRKSDADVNTIPTIDKENSITDSSSKEYKFPDRKNRPASMNGFASGPKIPFSANNPNYIRMSPQVSSISPPSEIFSPRHHSVSMDPAQRKVMST